MATKKTTKAVKPAAKKETNVPAETQAVVLDFLILVSRLADARLEVEREVFLCAVQARAPAHSVYSFEASG